MPTLQLEGLKPMAKIRSELQAPSPIQGLTGLQNCSQLITIECMRAIYQFGVGNTSHSNNVIGIGKSGNIMAILADYLR